MTKIYITEDGERIEATGEVLQAILDIQSAEQAKRAENDLATEAKAIAKAALLDRLGITAEEAALLLT